MTYSVGRRLHRSQCRRLGALLTVFAGLWLVPVVVSSAPAASLPDQRGYELVSPSDLQGASLFSAQDDSASVLPGTWSAVAADGSAVLWRLPTGGTSNAHGLVDFYRSEKAPDGAWRSQFAGPPAGTGVLGPLAAPSLVFATPNLDRLLWGTGPLGSDPSDPGSDLYTVSSDGTIDHVNRGPVEVPAPNGEYLLFVGATQDLSKVVFSSDRALAPGATGNNIYWTDGHTTKLVGKDDNGVVQAASLTPLTSPRASADASIVAFVSPAEQDLYFWSEKTDKTVKALGPISGLAVESISADGAKIFITTSATLTAGDTDSSLDLYEYNTSTRDITLLSAPSGGGPVGNSDACATPLPNRVQCDIAPVTESRDGSVVYFLSPERLVGNQGVDGGANLYLAEHGGIRFVATLDPSDPAITAFDPNIPNAGFTGIRARHVRLTPDSRKLIFESRAALTSYHNAGFVEIYLYDSTSHKIACASCRTDGTPPTGDSALSSVPLGRPETTAVTLAAPMGTLNSDEHGDRIFFNSTDALVPADVNGRNDVYQYTVATGMPALISSGRSDRHSGYMGNGLDGRDVFFLTTDTLVPDDHNGTVFKMYDARVGASPQPPSPTPSCLGSACRVDEAAPPLAPQRAGALGPRSSKPSPAATPSRVVLSGSRSVKGTSLRLTAKVSGAGRLSVSGSGLARVSRKTSRAATYHVTVRLSKASAAKLRRARARRLVVSATVRFVPSKGTARSVRVRLIFNAPSTHNAR